MQAQTIVDRVPHILFLYWIIKIASTTLGETGADMFSMTYDIGYGNTIVLFMGLFVILLSIKLRIKRYEPILYWLTFTATAIAGTAISDFIDRTLGLGYTGGSLLLVSLLVLILWGWYVTEKSINVECITSTQSEVFYWMAFLIANTLGTAAGDFLADEMGIGFAQSAMLISAVLALLALLHYKTAVSKVLLFWLAFVLTRPFGATFGDLLTKTHEKGGLDLGTIGSSVFFAIVLIIAVRQEVKREREIRYC
ncbi:hypothetical protein [Sulfuricurvum sp.]|uniref:COG4705 family protein n=1 Tax=Sulfuricurvum sp. TaxID=2025608 RepID=UPI002D452271|nr:hypothetical protein [Sulfuricurvum sp.]HZF70151.1 hypothetical protein [Sulfuricurvum sp.]